MRGYVGRNTVATLAEAAGSVSQGADYSGMVGAFKRAMLHELGHESVGLPRWQPRFWEHCIRDETDHQRHFDYIHWNYTHHPGEWPHSSYRSYVEAGWYSVDWIADPEIERLGEGSWDVGE
jgi:hypothetical protein